MPRNQPAPTAEGRERQMIALAVDLAERKLRDGTARASTIEHYLKLGATDYELRKQNMRLKNEHIMAQIRALDRSENSDNLINDAISAIQRYSGKYGIEEITDEDIQ